MLRGTGAAGGASDAAAPAGWPTAAALSGAPVRLHQDATVYVSEADAGLTQEAAVGAGRAAYLVCIEGALAVAATTSGGGKKGDEEGERHEERLEAREAAQISGPAAGGTGAPLALRLTAGAGGAHFMLLEMAAAPAMAW